jgi:DNA-binding response OmpR family regulator
VPQGRALVAVGAELQQQLVEVLRGWAVISVADGEAAIDHLWEGSPDLVILDFDLPRQSAYDVIRHLSMRRPELLDRTIVLFDGPPEVHALVHAVPIGTRLQKPFDAANLESAIARVAGI